MLRDAGLDALTVRKDVDAMASEVLPAEVTLPREAHEPAHCRRALRGREQTDGEAEGRHDRLRAQDGLAGELVVLHRRARGAAGASFLPE